MSKLYLQHDYQVTGKDYVETEGGDTPAGGVDYSEEEQDTGRKWIDGSEIFVKSWIFESSIIIAANSVVSLDSSGVTIPGGNYIINAEVVSTADKRVLFPFFVGYASGEIKIQNTESSAMSIGALTLYYTKIE